MKLALNLGLAAIAALCLTACEGDAGKGSAVTKVASTTSFGMCMGYCKTTLEISANEAVLTREAWGRGAASGLPTQRFNVALSAQEWNDIAGAAAAAKIDGLPETIGCPDCADGR
jgi:hypothetical protein